MVPTVRDARSSSVAHPRRTASPLAIRLGWRLYEQSCSICHTKPNLVLGQFGPVLSRESLNGRPELVREVIANGTPRMPGFKHHFAPAEIDAIAAYVQTLPPAEKR